MSEINNQIDPLKEAGLKILSLLPDLKALGLTAEIVASDKLFQNWWCSIVNDLGCFEDLLSPPTIQDALLLKQLLARYEFFFQHTRGYSQGLADWDFACILNDFPEALPFLKYRTELKARGFITWPRVWQVNGGDFQWRQEQIKNFLLEYYSTLTEDHYGNIFVANYRDFNNNPRFRCFVHPDINVQIEFVGLIDFDPEFGLIPNFLLLGDVINTDIDYIKNVISHFGKCGISSIFSSENYIPLNLL